QGINTVGDGLQGVDIEAGVGFVENRQRWLQYQHLQNFITLFFAAGKAFVDTALDHVKTHADVSHLVVNQFHEIGGADLRFVVIGATGVDGGAQQIQVGHAGDLHR